MIYDLDHRYIMICWINDLEYIYHYKYLCIYITEITFHERKDFGVILITDVFPVPATQWVLKYL